MTQEGRAAEILDAAQRLFAAEGYAAVSVNRIVAEAGVAKGTFYHYFDSRESLLAAVVDRMNDEIVQDLVPNLGHERVPPIERLNEFFGSLNSWKTARRAELMVYIDAFYRPENRLVHLEAQQQSIERLAPHIAEVIAEGVSIGDLTTVFPNEAAEYALLIIDTLGRKLVDKLLELRDAPNADEGEILLDVEKMVEAAHDAVERVIGALRLLDRHVVREWFDF